MATTNLVVTEPGPRANVLLYELGLRADVEGPLDGDRYEVDTGDRDVLAVLDRLDAGWSSVVELHDARG